MLDHDSDKEDNEESVLNPEGWLVIENLDED